MAALSKRLEVALSFLHGVKGFADIGCDHGYLPIEAVKRKIVDYAIASDNKMGPYLKAKNNIELALLSDKIEVRLEEGVGRYPDSINAISILGMGGELMVDILEKANLDPISTLILGPNSETKQLRYFLQNHNFMIEDESFIKDHGHYYQIIRAVRGKMVLSLSDATFGPLNIKRKNPIMIEFVNKEIVKLESALLAAGNESKPLIQQKINELREVIM